MKYISVSQAQKVTALSRNSYFSELSARILEELSQGVSFRRYARGEVLFWEGDPCEGLYIIERGSVKLFKTSVQGRELIIRVLEEAETFNEVPVFDRGQNPVNAAALEDCDIWVVNSDVIQRAVDAYPEMNRFIIKNLTENLRMLVGKVEELSFFQVTNRLARLLNQLPAEQLAGSPRQRITQDQLAARLGTVREVVARSLRELERSGAIQINRRRIEIQNQEILLDWAQSPYD